MTRPFRENEPDNAWLRVVWHHLIQTSQTLSLREMERQFGDAPSCSFTPQQMLDSAVLNEFFKRVGGTPDRYYATRPLAKEVLPDSQFSGIKRVNSVWELAA